MSKRKGVSAEEKRTRLLQLFYETKQFYQLKELEKIAPAEKGIIANSIKDVLQSLVDDGLVDTDKIGTSVYFWAFQSKAKNNRKRKLDDLNKEFQEETKKLKTVEQELEKTNVVAENPDEIKKLKENIIDLQIQRDELKNTFETYKKNDPQLFEKKKKATELLRDTVNRWTDNIFCIKTWCKNKTCLEEKEINRQLGIPEDLDYIE